MNNSDFMKTKMNKIIKVLDTFGEVMYDFSTKSIINSKCGKVIVSDIDFKTVRKYLMKMYDKKITTINSIVDGQEIKADLIVADY